jgi:hypothetical protein
VRESTKEWRGDPHELAMNSLYTALLYWLHGEHDNARAGAKAAILADSDSKEGYRSDLALSYWLAGRMSRRLGADADADGYYAQALEARRQAVGHGADGEAEPAVLLDPDHGNVVLVVDVGMGPEKYADGDYGSLARFRPALRPEHHGQVWVDGKPVGHTQVLADVFFQAITRGGRVMDGILKGKAVFKTGTMVAGAVVLHQAAKHRSPEAAAVGGGLLLLSLLTSARADTRHLALLPATVQVLTLNLPPGEHDLRLEFHDAGGRPLGGLTQDWRLAIEPDREHLFYFRSLQRLDRRDIEPAPPDPRAETKQP